MELPEVTDTLDPIPEAFRVNYQQSKDGKFELKHVAGLRANNASLLGEKKTLGDRLKPFEGINPDELPEMRSVYGQHKDSKLTDKEKAEKALKERDDRIAALESERRADKLKTGLRKIMVDAGMFETDVDDEIELNAKRFDLDKDGNIVPKDATTGAPEKFFTETYKTKKPKVYKPEGGSGSGASNTQNGGGSQKTMTRAAFNQLDPAGQMAHVKGGGLVAD